MSLTPEERFRWLKEAHEFVSKAVPYEKIKRWKNYMKKESIKGDEILDKEDNKS